MPTDAYPGLSAAEGYFKTLIWQPLLDACVSAVVGSSAVFGYWPLTPIVTFVINQAGSILYGWLALIVDMEAITLVNADHELAYESASERLEIVAAEKGTGSPEYAASLQVEIAALRKFVSFASSP